MTKKHLSEDGKTEISEHALTLHRNRILCLEHGLTLTLDQAGAKDQSTGEPRRFFRCANCTKKLTVSAFLVLVCTWLSINDRRALIESYCAGSGNAAMLAALRALGLGHGSSVLLPDTNNPYVPPTASVARDSNSTPMTDAQPAEIRPASRMIELEAEVDRYKDLHNKLCNASRRSYGDLAEAMEIIRELLGEARKGHESENTGGSSNNKRRRCR